MDWSRAKLFDFTGVSEEGGHYARFGDDVIQVLREPADLKLAIVLDTGFGWQSKKPAVVQDHINLSGHNPLIGPNHPIGERFPVTQGIYVTSMAEKLGLERVIVAGIKHGRSLSAEDADFMHVLGADCYCFNVVPTMLIAAHAGWKILALVGPDNRSWQTSVLKDIRKLTSQLQESVS